MAFFDLPSLGADWKIVESIHSDLTITTVAPQNPSRWGLFFSNPSTQTYNIGTTIFAGPILGIQLGAGGIFGPIYFQQVGAWVQLAWLGNASVGGGSLVVTELIYLPATRE